MILTDIKTENIPRYRTKKQFPAQTNFHFLFPWQKKMPAFSKLSQCSILHSNICDAHPIPFLSDRHYYEWCCWNVSRKSITSFVTQEDATGGDFHDINPEIFPRMSYFLLKKLLTLTVLYYHITPFKNSNKLYLTTYITQALLQREQNGF